MTRKASFFLGAFLILACLVVLYNLRQPSPRPESAGSEITETPIVVAPLKKAATLAASPKTPAATVVAKDSSTQQPATPLPAAQGSTIKGKVTFQSAPPSEKSVSMAADAACAAQHSTTVTSRHYVLGTNGGLANVFIALTSGLGDRTFPPPKKPVVLDQKGCLYFPYVFGFQTGQPLEVLNSDATLHNVNIQPNNNPPVNRGMPVKDMKFTIKFANPEVDAPVQFKCDVHPWMFAYAFVLPHPFFVSTGEDGLFQLQGLPAGTYTIQTWHHKAGKLTQTVAVGENETKEVSFEFRAEQK